MLTGVLLGLAAALLQSLSYLFSRRFVRRHAQGVRGLMVLSHLWMGLFSVLLLPWLWPPQWPALSQFAWPLAGTALSYLFGQAALFFALRGSDASRISPLLGIKIALLAGVETLIFGHRYAGGQWAAVGCALAAAVLLSRTGGVMRPASLVWVGLACLGYSLSDLHIRPLVLAFSSLGLFRASAVGVCLTYVLCGILVLPLAGASARATRAAWIDAAPFAAAWFGGMLFLFACFARIGVVFGNIAQSSRGVLSVGLGALVAAAGHHHIEGLVSRGLLLRRVAAALLMSAAIALFYLGAG